MLLSIVLVNLLLHADIVTDRNVAVAEEDFDAALLKSALKISCILIINQGLFGHGGVLCKFILTIRLRILVDCAVRLRILVRWQQAVDTEIISCYHLDDVALVVFFCVVD